MAKDKKTRILLINPPVYDFRLDWVRWQQPCGLLQVGGFLRARGYDVRLFDCLQVARQERVQRKKLDTMDVGGPMLLRWHFGWSWDQLERMVGELKEEDWKPDAVYITCLMTFWWQSVRDLVERAHRWFPRMPIVLGGAYPTLCPGHAKQNMDRIILDSKIGKLATRQPTDLSLYEKPPHFAGVLLHRSRSANQIVRDISIKIDLGVREFAFFDDDVPGDNRKHFEGVLDLIVARKLKLKLIALGNISPRALDKNLVVKMREAGFQQIFLRDDNSFDSSLNKDLDTYERGIELLLKYGEYKPRTGDVTAMILAGAPNENLEQVAERITRLAHIVGSVNLIPYQPTPGSKVYERYNQNLPVELEKQNGKLFPFAQLNHVSFSDYQELTRLAALLNSKYRSTTFDFLGDNEIAKMIQQSIAQEGWKPRLRERLPLPSK